MEAHIEKLLYQIIRIRLIEEKIAEIYPTDQVQSPVHLSIGQEPASVCICGQLEKEDLVFGTYRGHALYLAKGAPLNSMMAELFGKSTGCGRGRAGSMHLGEPSYGVMGTSAIVASTIPHAVGAAYAAKLRKSKQVTVCFLGEGATSEGVYHESLNLAALHKLPILFVCENNGLAIYTRSQDFMSYDLVEHAKSYGLQTDKIDLENYSIENLYAKSKNMIEQIRLGDGPFFLEIEMCRYFQHVGPNKDTELDYRISGEYEFWMEKDPLRLYPELVEKYKQDIIDEIDAAIKFAQDSPFPDQSDLMRDVY